MKLQQLWWLTPIASREEAGAILRSIGWLFVAGAAVQALLSAMIAWHGLWDSWTLLLLGIFLAHFQSRTAAALAIIETLGSFLLTFPVRFIMASHRFEGGTFVVMFILFLCCPRALQGTMVYQRLTNTVQQLTERQHEPWWPSLIVPAVLLIAARFPIPGIVLVAALYVVRRKRSNRDARKCIPHVSA